LVLNTQPTIDRAAKASKPDLMSQPEFTLHTQLAADCLTLADWPLCRVLRMRDRNYPWLVLVPRRADMREIIDLDPADQQALLGEIGLACRAIKAAHRTDKLNVAALGNVVPQLHVHVIGRTTTDAAWPRPIWGAVPPLPIPDGNAPAELKLWRDAFTRQGL
jgi:diadenosine tetraphosphate (Ap4A) HIT family hydrolase